MMDELFAEKDMSITLSTEEYTGMYTKKLTKQLEDMYVRIMKDKELNLNYREYFAVSYYKDMISDIEKGINKYFNINVKIVPNESLAIYIDNDDKELTKTIKKVMKGDTVDYVVLSKYLNKLKVAKHGNKLKSSVTVYLGMNIHNSVIVNKKTPDELAKDILDTIESVFDINEVNNGIITDMNNILEAVKDGKDVSYIYSEVLSGNDDVEGVSDYKQVVKIGERIIERATEEKEGNKLSILVRINYLILLVTVLIVIYTALSVPALGYSIATLLVYNIFLYIYKLVVKVLTGDKDPLNENFKQTKIEGINTKDNIIVDLVKKNGATLYMQHAFDNVSDSVDTIKNKIYNILRK